jgi:CBS domain-containing protein
MPATVTHTLYGTYLMPSLRHATVSDAMHPGIVSCPADATLRDVARLMATHHVHWIAVMGISRDARGERLVWGLISDIDVMRAGIRVSPNESAGALALEPIVSVDPAMPLREAGELMLKHDVSHVVVVDPATQRPTGILSTMDVIGVLAWGDE